MRRLFQFLALALAAFWLPATLHCGLQAIDVLAHGHEEGSYAGCAALCSSDACELVEGGQYSSPASTPKFAVPAVWIIHLIARAAVHEAPASAHWPGREAPPGLARNWQFIARAALLPGAPSLLV